ncbi:MAG: phosphate ABC transporter permease PstA [Hyphomicrobium sp.]
MTDLTSVIERGPPRVPQSPASSDKQQRLARRRRADARFRSYGLVAIMLAISFLALIVADITFKALPAFTHHSLKLNVPVTAGLVDAAQPNAGDYDGLIKNALRGLFPEVKSRADKKSLDSLLSSGAADPLRERIVANPALVGQTLSADLLLSSSADLYLKGISAQARTSNGAGPAKPSDTSGIVTLVAEPDALAPDLAGIAKNAEGGVTFDTNTPTLLVAINGGIIKIASITQGAVQGEVLAPLTSASSAASGAWQRIVISTPESSRKINDRQIAFLELLKQQGAVESGFNFGFFTNGDSREPELAGILGGLMGTAYTMLVTLGLCLPIGVAAAIYLEEFAPRNRVTDLIEVNINNLAAVPSIVFGLLGLAVFLNVFGLPRSSPLVGGLVLALLVLPTIIIASRAALKAVPPSVREAAIGVGATRQQAIFHHVLPVAMPGIMTGTIIGMAHALGETAPLLMIGMIAFIADVPGGPTEAATVLPVQIFLWSDLPEAGFQSRTAAAILVLLAFLVLMNSLAIWLRNKFERRW